MDKRTILAFVLVAIIFIVWQYIWVQNTPPPQQTSEAVDSTEVRAPDTRDEREQTRRETDDAAATDSSVSVDYDTIPEQLFQVETDKYWLTLSSKGGGLVKLQLKDYSYSDGDSGNVYILEEGSQATPSLIDRASSFSDQGLAFVCDGDDLILSGATDSASLEFRTSLPQGGEIVKIFTFYGDRYDFGLDIELNETGPNLFSIEYVLAWLPPMSPTEINLSDDYDNFKGGVFLNGAAEMIDDFDNNKLDLTITGNAEWVGARSKYFAYSMIPRSSLSSGAYFKGQTVPVKTVDSEYDRREISAGIIMPTSGSDQINGRFTIVAGPLDYHVLKNYNVDLEEFIDWGWKIIEPFAVAAYWVMYQLYKIIPNYGFVILIMATLMKIVLFPLTKKSLKSMLAMQKLQPKMQEIKEKYKKDPQKMNKEVMKLYKDEKINPMGSCLYMLPQMPLFIGLYQVLRSTIELRQAFFIFYWPDLSLPDHFPYIMPLLMALTMFIQQKMTIKDPKQKMMIYLMPAVLFFVFKGLPVGAVWYWTSMQIVGIVETFTIRRPMMAEQQNPQVK